jgi:hypothetical protein
VRSALAGWAVAALVITTPTVVGMGAPAGRSPTSATGTSSDASFRLIAASLPVGQDPTFPIRGSIQGLAPGVRSQLAITISNPFPFPIRVVQLTVVVGNADGPCMGKDLEIQPFHGPLQIGAGATATTSLGVTLSNRSPDVCQAATWPLAYRGQAVQVAASSGGAAAPPASGGTDNPGPSAEPASAAPGRGLPLTGLAVSTLIAAAALLLAGGAAILLAQRRRRSGLARLTEDSQAP